MVKKVRMIWLPTQSAAKVFVLAILCIVAGSTLAFADQPSGMMCDYSAYLDEPVPRARFIAMQNEMYQKSQARAAGDSRYSGLSSDPAGAPEGQVDDVSRGCLGCHEEMGMMLKNGSAYPKGLHNGGMVKMAVSHRIGMDYESKTLFRSDLKSAAEFSPNMVLVNGKVGCVTCHDPLNHEGNHLATNSNRSGICFACHNM